MDDSTATVFVVDDDGSVRRALQRLIESVGLRCETFGTANEFLERVTRGDSGCLVLDIRMPGVSGLELQRTLLAGGCDLPIIFISAHANVPLTVQAMKAGALEVLTKPFNDQALIDAVHQALEIERARSVERQQTQRVLEHYGRLTRREREVMALVVVGKLNKQVAADLGMSERTVKVHRARVMIKMQADSLADLVEQAHRLRAARPGKSQTYSSSPQS
jgi:FixJ family two-component response regulator